MRWEPVIGLEIHAQLATETKMFCGCAVRTGAPPNTLVCPVCLGLPGALPVLNARAVDLGLLAALALGCRVQPVSVFARKNYFYPDLPKGYQISQYDRPLALGGALEWTEGGAATRVAVVRLHLEEDAGKLLHEGVADASCVDFNRSGVPLVEIVTAPEIRSAASAAASFERLRAILVELGASAGNLEEGHLRCDANVSLRRPGETALGAPVEVKNLNSFRYLSRALEYEIARQAEVLDAGGRVVRETRQFDVSSGRTLVMRAKEQADDYRYFPEPDLPPLPVTAERVEALRARLPELPDARRRRLRDVFGLSDYDAAQVGATPALARYFEEAARASGHPKAVANWMTGELARRMKEGGHDTPSAGVAPDALAELIAHVDRGVVSTTLARQVLDRMWGSGRRAAEVVASEGVGRVDDAAALERIVRDTLAAHPRGVAQFKAGKTQVIGFFVGQVMKATRGQANPERVSAIVRRELERA